MSHSTANVYSVSGTAAAVLSTDALDRRAYALLLERECHLACTEAGFDSAEIRAALRQSSVVVCLGGPVELRRTARIANSLPRAAPIVAVVTEVGPVIAQMWRRGDLGGLVPRSCELRSFQNCIVYVRRGERHLGVPSREVAPTVPLANTGLTRREQEIFVLLGRGLKLKDAAARMGISEKTADSHRTRLMRKLGVSNRTELAHRALSTGVIELMRAAVSADGRIVDTEQNPQTIDRSRLATLMAQRPDATLSELRSLLGVPCSLSAIWDALQQARSQHSEPSE